MSNVEGDAKWETYIVTVFDEHGRRQLATQTPMTIHGPTKEQSQFAAELSFLFRPGREQWVVRLELKT